MSKRQQQILHIILTYVSSDLDSINNAMRDLHLPIESITYEEVENLCKEIV